MNLMLFFGGGRRNFEYTTLDTKPEIYLLNSHKLKAHTLGGAIMLVWDFKATFFVNIEF